MRRAAPKRDTDDFKRHSRRTERSTRIDWVDYAKGICIVMVVMMHSVLGVEKAAGDTGFMHAFVVFAQPFRMPDFFLISGLFLAVVIDRDWRTYLDRKVVHFAYFYVLWMTIQFGFKAPGFAAEQGWRHVGLLYLESFIEPFGTLWFIYLLPMFFVVTKLSRGIPAVAVWVVAAALEMAHVATGWTVIDEFCARFVYFYSGYLFAAYVFALCGSFTGEAGAGADWIGAVDARQWRPRDVGLQPLAAHLAGAWVCGRVRHHRDGHAAGAHAVAQLPALLRRAFHRHLSRLLPADGGDPDAAAEDRPDHRYRDDFLIVTVAGVAGAVSDLAAGAGTARRLPVRTPRRLLDRAEKGRGRRCSRRSRSLNTSRLSSPGLCAIAHWDRATQTPGSLS